MRFAVVLCDVACVTCCLSEQEGLWDVGISLNQDIVETAFYPSLSMTGEGNQAHGEKLRSASVRNMRQALGGHVAMRLAVLETGGNSWTTQAPSDIAVLYVSSSSSL